MGVPETQSAGANARKHVWVDRGFLTALITGLGAAGALTIGDADVPWLAVILVAVAVVGAIGWALGSYLNRRRRRRESRIQDLRVTARSLEGAKGGITDTELARIFRVVTPFVSNDSDVGQLATDLKDSLGAEQPAEHFRRREVIQHLDELASIAENQSRAGKYRPPR